jgi:hypothetical protein
LKTLPAEREDLKSDSRARTLLICCTYQNLSDVDATLLEPASCAAHGLDKIAPKMGSSVLIFGGKVLDLEDSAS